MSLIESMRLMASGDVHAMRLWLIANEPPQPNNHAPLCDCNIGLLMLLIAAQTLKMEGDNGS